jgi:hypothetical protein
MHVGIVLPAIFVEDVTVGECSFFGFWLVIV